MATLISWIRRCLVSVNAIVLVSLVTTTIIGSAGTFGFVMRASAAEARADTDALHLLQIRHTLADSVNRLTMARVAAAAGQPVRGLDLDLAGTTTDLAVDQAIEALDELRDSTVANEATNLRDVLIRDPDIAADRLDVLLNQRSPELLDALVTGGGTDDRRILRIERVVDQVDATVEITNTVVIDVARAFHRGNASEEYTGRLRSFLGGNSSGRFIPREIRPREVLPTDANGFVVDLAAAYGGNGFSDIDTLAEIDPEAAAAIRNLVESEPLRGLQDASQWAVNLLLDESYSPSPASLSQVVEWALELSDTSRDVFQTMVDDAEADARGAATRRASIAVAVFTLAVLVLVIGLGALAVMVRVRGHHERRMRAAADTDALTGLSNRRAMDTHAIRFAELPDEACHVVLHLDLDRFKEVNDAHGHAVGDQLLVAFSKILREAVRDHDIVARIGGDEFVIILDGGTRAVSTWLAEKASTRIQESAAQSLQLGPLTVEYGVSIGMVIMDGAFDLTDVGAQADLALYEAKAAGRGRSVLAESK